MTLAKLSRLCVIFSLLLMAGIALSQSESEYQQVTLKSGQKLIGKIKFVGNGAIITMTNGITKTLPSSQIDTWDPVKLGADNKGGITIEKVNLFPDKYIGQKFVFCKCEVHCNLEPFGNTDYFLLPVTKDGFYVVTVPSDNRIVFAVRRAMAEKMADDLKGGYNWPNCTISCVITKMGDYYFAVVDRLDIYNRGGTIGTTYITEK